MSSALEMLEEAEAVLRDIHPNEISFVDRAANRRRFAMVKGAAAMSDLTLQKSVKESALPKITEPLQRLTKVASQIKEASESDQGQAQVPDELAKEVVAAADAIRQTFGPEPDALAKALDSLSADTRAALSKVDIAKMPELVDGMSETADKMKVLGAATMALGGAETPEQVKAIADKLSEVGGVDLTQSQGGGQPANPPAQPSGDDTTAKLVKAVEALTAKVDEIDKRTKGDEQPANKGDGKGGGEAEPSAAEIAKRLETLSKKVDEIAETPATPASQRGEGGPNGAPPRKRTTEGSKFVI